MFLIIFFICFVYSSAYSVHAAGIDGVLFGFNSPVNVVTGDVGPIGYIAYLNKFEAGECRLKIYPESNFEQKFHKGRWWESGRYVILSKPVKEFSALCLSRKKLNKEILVKTGLIDDRLLAIYFEQPNVDENIKQVISLIAKIGE